MANTGLNGFEKDDLTSIGREWTIQGTVTIPATGRRNTNCLRITSASGIIFRAVPADETYHFGFSFLFEGVGFFPRNVASIRDIIGTIHLSLCVAPTGALVIRNVAETVLWTSTSLLLANTWYYIEWSTTCATAGSTAVYINGASTPDSPAYSGDTQNGSNTITVFAFGANDGTGTPVTARYGDWYANSATGGIAKDNTRWGDTKVVAYLPNAAGNVNGLVSITTGTAAATNYLEVDDPTTEDDDTTYVYGTSAVDSYNFPALGFTPLSIQSVVTRITAKKTDAGARTIATRTRSNSVDYDSSAEALGTSYTVFAFVQPQNPNTSTSWTQSTYEAAEFGPKVA